MNKEEMIRKAINELDYVESNLAYDELPNIRKALDYLDQIESVEGSEVIEVLDRLNRRYFPTTKGKADNELSRDMNAFQIIKSYIQQQTQRKQSILKQIDLYEEVANDTPDNAIICIEKIKGILRGAEDE